MKKISLPPDYNYIGAFLTLDCNLNCTYCINKHGHIRPVIEMSGDDWFKGLSRIETRNDLPITLQGGEPTLHPQFYEIANLLHIKGKHLDLLTNGQFSAIKFMSHITPDVFKRGAKYASIRFSYHQKTNDIKLAMKAWSMQRCKYEVGVWSLNTLDNKRIEWYCKRVGIDFRVKEFLGLWNGQLHGTYKYPDAVRMPVTREVECKPSELLIGPSGDIFRCHRDLYANNHAIGHILDKKIKFRGYMKCEHYGRCNPCDVKLKTNRFQEFGHCSVIIRKTEAKEDKEVSDVG